MYTHEVSVRVRYAETDQMGFVYHGHFATWLEIARVEALRNVGVSYRELEEEGILMPVLDLQLHFLQPAKYDQVLRVVASVPEMPRVKIRFSYEIFNEEDCKICEASTTLVFLQRSSMKPVRTPVKVLERLSPFF
jgi:acyl-CoA thioester hydrolase